MRFLILFDLISAFDGGRFGYIKGENVGDRVDNVMTASACMDKCLSYGTYFCAAPAKVPVLIAALAGTACVSIEYSFAGNKRPTVMSLYRPYPMVFRCWFGKKKSTSAGVTFVKNTYEKTYNRLTTPEVQCSPTKIILDSVVWCPVPVP